MSADIDAALVEGGEAGLDMDDGPKPQAGARNIPAAARVMLDTNRVTSMANNTPAIPAHIANRLRFEQFPRVALGLVLGFVLALTSCSNSVEPAAAKESDTLRPYQGSEPGFPGVHWFQKRWRDSKITCYEFELESWEGFFGNETLVITVDSSRVTSARVVRSGQYYPDSLLWIVPTIDSIFDFGIRHANDPGQFTGVFDPTYGFPYSLVYDPLTDRHSSVGFIVRWFRKRTC